MTQQADALIVGAGLSGLVAAAELVAAGKRVIIVDQEPAASFGGQAWWAFGGLFLVDSPEQRRMGIRDSHELARQDWLGSAAFDRPEDEWPRRWAEAYLAFAAGEQRSWLRQRDIGLFPVVGWAERGGYGASGHGNSVPRFHIVWGTGPALLEPFARTVRDGIRSGTVSLRFRHRVDGLVRSGTAVVGVQGSVLAPDAAIRGAESSRRPVGSFELSAGAVLLTSGGIGGNHDLVRKHWPARLGEPPQTLLSGVPASVDGRMLEIAEQSGARLINRDRMWHYPEGVDNFAPVWSRHGVRILPGPSSIWLDATGARLPVPLFPGFDTLGTLEQIVSTGYDHSWFVLNQSIIEKEFALSGSEQNPDLTGKSIGALLKRLAPGAPGPVEAFKSSGADFVVADTLDELLIGMQRLAPLVPFDAARVRLELQSRDRQIENPYGKDAQLTAIRGARKYRGDRLLRVVRPHRILDPAHFPLIAVKLHVLTRKTLGGIETDLEGRVLDAAGSVLPGLFAAGEASGFGGGGMHGYRALEGTFLGGCLFSGRQAGRAIAAQA
jgi:predicted oxidoreductase